MKLFQIFFQKNVNIVFIVKRGWFTFGLQYRAYIVRYLAAVLFELLFPLFSRHIYFRYDGVTYSDINVTAIKKVNPPNIGIPVEILFYVL